jgi:hypothetical protein
VQCLTDDEPEHTLPVEYDSHTIDNLIQTMSTLSLDNVAPISFADVPSHLSPLDNVSSLFDLSLSFDNVSFDDVFDDESTFYKVRSNMIFGLPSTHVWIYSTAVRLQHRVWMINQNTSCPLNTTPMLSTI